MTRIDTISLDVGPLAQVKAAPNYNGDVITVRIDSDIELHLPTEVARDLSDALHNALRLRLVNA